MYIFRTYDDICDFSSVGMAQVRKMKIDEITEITEG